MKTQPLSAAGEQKLASQQLQLEFSTMDSNTSTADYLRKLYPQVESMDLLPTSWSKKDKFTFIGLSKQDLRVHYKGIGKTHKDAASVRTNQPIPVACGVFYFEIKVLSKGRDGYMGLGLSQANVSLNRLPGWDKHSYGYHGDDGHSFCSSGTGKPYGPTFTTQDVIGCGVNLIDKTCFYTKNGINLGVAFTDLPTHLYPTVGLQTPGEVVEANFGQNPFMFDIQTELLAARTKLYRQVETYGDGGLVQKDDDRFINEIVLSYLTHHGFTSTAEAFSKSSGISITEDISSVRKRQHLQKLILSGKMSEATDFIDSNWSEVLVYDELLLLMVKIRQFIEMVSGHDTQPVIGSISPKRNNIDVTSVSVTLQPSDTNNAVPECNGSTSVSHSNGSCMDSEMVHDDDINPSIKPESTSSNGEIDSREKIYRPVVEIDGEINTSPSRKQEDDGQYTSSAEEMEVEEIERHENNGGKEKVISSDVMNGSSVSAVSVKNGGGYISFNDIENGEEMDITVSKGIVPRSSQNWEKLLAFGRHLQELYDTISGGDTDHPYDNVLKDAFSLLAYADPATSPLAHLLLPDQREHVWSALNSAILVQQKKAAQPALDRLLIQIRDLTMQLLDSGCGACAFLNASEYFK